MDGRLDRHDPCDDANCENFAKARAAIEAMRDPTDAMLVHVSREPVHLYDEGERGAEYQRQMAAAVAVDRMVRRQQWRDLIDAALA
jgi:hypothetical protein